MKVTRSVAGAVLALALASVPVAASAQYGYGNSLQNQYQDRDGDRRDGDRRDGDRRDGDRGGWDAPPGSYTRDLQRAAFRDGLEGARRDLQNRRRPDVRNRDEFRNYRGPERGAYRDAFRAGYNAFWQHQGYRGY